MKLHEIPTPILRQILKDTERSAGSDSEGARAFREELARRKSKAQKQEGKTC